MEFKGVIREKTSIKKQVTFQGKHSQKGNILKNQKVTFFFVVTENVTENVYRKSIDIISFIINIKQSNILLYISIKKYRI